MLSESEGRVDDWRYVSMYEEFVHMRDLGLKYREAVRMLSEEYQVGRATVERLLKRMGAEC